MLKLRPYQKQARKAIRAAYKSGKRKIIVAHATGTGKTVLFARTIQKRPGRALVLAHRAELIQQAANKLMDVGITPGIVKAVQKQCDADVIVASVQTIINCLPQVLSSGPFRTVVVDEAHHAIADTYQTILDAVLTPKTLCLGVTATPFRGNPSEGLGDVFEEIVHAYGIEQAIQDGFLCPIVAKSVKLVGADYSKLKIAHGDITESSAAKVLHEAHAPYQVAQAIVDLASDRKSLIFAPTVEIASEIEIELAKRQFPVASIFGHTSEDKRALDLGRFSDGSIKALVNCGVLTEGYDEPSVSCVAMVRPTKSQVLFTQCIGRGTRPHPDKANLLVLDFVGATHRHDLVTVSHVLPKSCPPSPGDMPVPKISPSFKAYGGNKAKGDSPYDWAFGGAFKHTNGKIVTTAVDLFKSRPFAWVKTSFGYVIDCGKDVGMVCLRHKDHKWYVSVLCAGDSTTTYVGHDFGYAQAHAEQFVKESGMAPLAKRDAFWRKAPITPGQSSALTKWKIPHTMQWTKGQASDALCKAIAEAQLKKVLG